MEDCGQRSRGARALLQALRSSALPSCPTRSSPTTARGRIVAQAVRRPNLAVPTRQGLSGIWCARPFFVIGRRTFRRRRRRIGSWPRTIRAAVVSTPRTRGSGPNIKASSPRRHLGVPSCANGPTELGVQRLDRDVTGMRIPVPAHPAGTALVLAYGVTIRDEGHREHVSGQADPYDEPRARVSSWPPLRPTRLRRERGSGVVVLPTAAVPQRQTGST